MTLLIIYISTHQRKRKKILIIMLKIPCLFPRYRQGMRGRMRAVILEMLQEYYRVEEAFQGEQN